MKGFLKMTLAVFLGLNLFLTVPFFFLLYLINSSSSELETKISLNSVFYLELSGELKERSDEDIFSLTEGMIDSQSEFLGLDDILSAIKIAKENENIKGIYLECGDFAAAPASIQEIQDALLDFKQTGKFIVSYADFYTQNTYSLASVSNKVFLNPLGALELKGVSLQNVFYKNLLDKIGVEVQVVKVGTFKSAIEPYIQTEMSDANRAQLTQLSSSIWNQIATTIASARNVKKECINEFVAHGLMLADAEETINYGLVDSLVYKNEVKSYLKTLMESDYESYSLKNILSSRLNNDFQQDKIAVVYAVGAIDNISSGEKGIDSKEISKKLLDIAEDKNIRALVLRVNSPGGSAFGSEQIWKAMTEVKKNKPVIVSMGDYAASGGYYISCIADTIVAQPSTLTGSIGIFGLVPNVEKLLDNIGITTDVVKTHDLSDFGTVCRPMSMAEKTLMQKNVDRGYELFVKRCAEGRKMSIRKLNEIAEGRVWSGIDAQKNGLVDVLGGLDDAIDFAAQKANVKDYQIVEYPKKKDIFTLLLEDFYNSGVRFSLGKMSREMNFLEMLENSNEADKIQALMPFDIVMN